jgi:hypothetical protein
MANVHAFMMAMFERMYAVSAPSPPQQTGAATMLMRQFADYAVEHNDLDNYLGFADVALGHLHFHHHFEGVLPSLHCRARGRHLTMNSI